MKIKIVLMQSEHLEEVKRLAFQLGYDVPSKILHSRFMRIQDSSESALFVALWGSNLAGWILVNAEPLTLLRGPSAEVAALVVDENHRGKKVGQMLLTHAEKWAKKNSFEQIRIRTNVNRAQAHGFYSHCGYTLSKSWHLFVKPIEKDADLV